MTNHLNKGTAATRDFYNLIGWRRRNGTLTDMQLFGWMDGAIRKQIEARRQERVLRAATADGMKVAELGCGGTPALFLAKRCSDYTAVDFSSVGLFEAAKSLATAGVPFKTVEADITHLPFDDGEFDSVYSAHAIYHIDTAEGQAAAFQEAMRVVRPGGCAIFILGNPFPLLFPMRAIRRALAMTPVLGAVLNRIRPKPPLPYLPMPLSWIKRQLSGWGDVRVACHALPSVAFDRLVSEINPLGRLIWRTVEFLESNSSEFAAGLGCYTLFVVRKSK
jgi:SAM-dependent methyltransferase